MLFRATGTSAPKKLSLSAQIDAGTNNAAADCVIKISDPASLSAVVFRSISELSKEIQTARALMPDQLPQIETQDKPLIAR